MPVSAENPQHDHRLPNDEHGGKMAVEHRIVVVDDDSDIGEVIVTTARKLGFHRVGKRIEARIGKRIAELIAAKAVRRADGDRLCAS